MVHPIDTYPGAIPPPPGVTPNLASPPDAGREFNIIILIIIDAVVVLFYALRIISNCVFHRRFRLEDLTCAVGIALLLFYSATVFLMIRYGLGYHEWDVSESDVDQVLKWLYASSILFIPAAFFIKATLLLLIARVFAVRRKIARAIHLFIIFIALANTPIQICKILVCRPISAFWRNAQTGICLDQRKLFLADLTLSIFTDLAILIIPIPLTWGLRMVWWRRMKIMVLLAGGGLAVGTTVYRLVRVVQFQNETDVTSAFVDIDVLTTTELAIGAVCACLPPANILISHVCCRYLLRDRHKRKQDVRDEPSLRGADSGSQVLTFDTELAMWTRKGSADRIVTSHHERMVLDSGAARDRGSVDSGFGRREGWLAPLQKAKLQSDQEGGFTSNGVSDRGETEPCDRTSEGSNQTQ